MPAEQTVFFDNNKDLQLLFGKYDQNLKLIEQEMGIRISRIEGGLRLSGSKEHVEKTGDLFNYLLGLVGDGQDVKKSDVIYAIRLAKSEKGVDFKRLAKEKIDV